MDVRERFPTRAGQCPTCDLPLFAVALCGETLERCGTCGGEFCTHPALRRVIAAHAPPPDSRGGAYVRPSPLSDPVRYRKCPACAEMMLRKNFRESSGIIVDVCSAHGTWFDQGELGQVFEFAATGALAAAERGTTRRTEDRRNLDAFERRIRTAGPRHYLGRHGGVAIDDLVDITRIIADLSDD